MAYKPMFGSKKREALWQCEVLAAYKAGRGREPICNLCDLPVTVHDAWDESHDRGRAKAFGGKSVGIAHRLCNRLHGQQVVVPAVAKSNAVRKRYLGITGPGLGRFPMQGGRRSRISKTMRHGVQPRLTLAEKHARTMAALRIVPIGDVELIPADLVPLTAE